MADLEVTWDISAPLQAVRLTVDALQDGFTDRALAQGVYDILGRQTIDAFDQQTSPGGDPWPELSPITLQGQMEITVDPKDPRKITKTLKRRSRRAHGRNARGAARALVNKGYMMRSLLPSRVGPGAIRDVSRGELRYGTNIPHAAYHNEGATQKVTGKQWAWMLHNLGVFKPPGSILRLPKRTFLEIVDATEASLTNLLELYFGSRLGGETPR